MSAPQAALKPGDTGAATALKKDIVILRKILKEEKEHWLKAKASDSLQAELDRLTDIQENASQLQLEVCACHFCAVLIEKLCCKVGATLRHRGGRSGLCCDHPAEEKGASISCLFLLDWLTTP